MLNETLGKVNFWLLFIGVNVTFFPMHIVGLKGMARRVYTYPAGIGWDVYNLVSTVGVFIIVLGVGAFIVNLVYSHLRGEPTGVNPWGADTLEWAVKSPPPTHGFAVPPIIDSRHPLWDQADLHRGDPDLMEFTHALSRWPLRWRATVITRTYDAYPEEVFRVAGPSIWPLWAALGTVAIFIAELVKLRIGALAGAAVVVGAVIRWNWPEPAPVTEEEEQAFEEEHGVPVRSHGSLAVARWGMGLSIVFAAIAFASLLLAYFYLRLDNPSWPPAGISLPPGGSAVLSSICILLAGIAVQRGLAAIKAGDQWGLRLGLIGTILLGAAGLALAMLDFAGLPFDSRGHAYGSIFHLLGAFVMALAAVALIMAALTLYWAFKGQYTIRRHVPVLNVARFWAAAVVMWLIGFATLYLTPYLT